MAATRTAVYTALTTRKAAKATPSTNGKKKVRWQWQIIPAEDAALVDAEVTYPTLPAGCILEHTVGSGLFKDGLFIGVPEQEECTVKVNYSKLPDDLRDWISTESGVSVTVDGVDLFVSSVWILSTDAGDATLDPDDFDVRFIGCHYYQEEALYKLDSQGAPIVIELQLQSLAKACLETVSIERLRTYILDTGNVAGRPVTGSRYARLFDLVYDNGLIGAPQAIYGWQQNRAADTHRAWLLPLQYLFEGVVECAGIVFARYMRGYAGSGNAFETIAFWVNGKRPFENTVTFNKQKHDGTRGPGTALAYSDLKYVGLISDVVTPGVLTSAGANWIGGLLGGSGVGEAAVGRGGDTLHGLGNCWNLLRAFAENACSKTLVRSTHDPVTGLWQLELEVIRLLDDSDTAPDTRGDLLPLDFLKGSLQWHPSEVVVRSAEAAIPGASGEDHTPVTKSTGGNVDEKPFAVTVVVHNLPSVRAVAEDHPQRYPIGSQNIPEFSSPNVMVETKGSFNTRTLYYETTPTFATAQIAMRVSPCCSVTYATTMGGTSVLTVSGATLAQYPPVPWIGNASGPAAPAQASLYYDILWYMPLVAMLIDEQRRLNLPYAIDGALLRIFARNHSDGNPHGTATLSGTYIGDFGQHAVGRVFQLTDFNLTTTFAALWDRTPSQTKVVITSVTPDAMKTRTQIEAVACADDLFFNPP